MDVIDAVKQRYSVRSYEDAKVEEEKINSVLEAARLAPSASNRQEWRFVVVRDSGTREKLSEAARGQKFVAEAPVVVACCAETDGHVMGCGHQCFLIDVAIAIEHMVLRGVELGLGSCWIGAFDQDKVKEILDIPDDIKIVELLPFGYAADSPKEKNRLPFEDIVKYEKWT